MSKRLLLADRALLFQTVRAFFAKKGVMEVDCPALSQAAPIDQHIDVMEVSFAGRLQGYLHTSPEYGMKRLLADQVGDIYQMSHVFRAEEMGGRHNPEFTMVEWYRLGISFQEMIQETLTFIHLFLGELKASTLTYQQAFLTFIGIDPHEATASELFLCAQNKAIDLPSDAAHWDKDTLLQLFVSLLIEPHVGKQDLFVLTHFPASQAALAQTTTDENGHRVALRFEVYYQGIELANGYHELRDPLEQRDRLMKSHEKRLEAEKPALKLDEHFLQALEKGLPDCCGVAVGFDRLMMLRHKETTLKAILPFAWDRA